MIAFVAVAYRPPQVSSSSSNDCQFSSQFHSSGVCKTRCDADRYTSPNELSLRSLRTYYTHRPNELSRPFPRADAPMLVRVPIAPASFLPRHFRAEIRQPVIHPGLHRSCHAALQQGRMAAHRMERRHRSGNLIGRRCVHDL